MIQKIIILLIINLFVQTAFAQLPSRLIMNSESRIVTPLSGTWQRITQDGVSQVELPFEEYNSGIVTYSKNIKVPESLLSNRQLHLYFLGLDTDIEININDQFLGKYLGGMTPFLVKIPQDVVGNSESLKIELKILPPSENLKKIKTKSIEIKKNTYGILRDFYLVGTSKIWMSSVAIETIQNGSNIALKSDLKISAFKLLKSNNDSLEVFKAGQNAKLKVELFDGESRLSESNFSFQLEDDRVLDTSIAISANNLEYWSTKDPKLYNIKYSILYNDIVLDDLILSTGVKFESVKDNKLLLNGKELQVKAVSYIEQYEGSSVLSREIIENDIDKITQLGANAIRFKFSPPHPYMAELCSKNGILMLTDLPAYDVPDKIINSKEIKVRLENIATRHTNYYERFVSNFALGIPGSLNFANIFAESNSLLYRFSTNNKLDNNLQSDFVVVDFAKNYYENNLDELLSGVNKPVLLNYGSMVQLDNNNGYSDDLSLEHQAHLLRVYYKMSSKNTFGNIFDSYNDYILENPTLKTNNENEYLSSSGLVTQTRNERISYQTARTLFKGEKEPLLNAGTEGGDSNILFIVIGIILTIVFVFLFNRLRRFREYVIRALFRPYNFYSDIRDQRIISSFQTFTLSIIVSFSFGIFVSSILYVGKSLSLFEYLSMIILPGKYIREQLFDFIWIPEALMMILTVMFFILIYLLSFILKILSFGIRSRIFLNDTITISVWSILPLVLLLPMGILSGRLIAENTTLLMVFLLVALFLIIWSLNRILKSTSVVFDIRSWKVYLIGFLILVAVIVTPLIFLQINHSILSYFEHFYKIYFS